jgi:glycosyltransferase involved in cell wall biosynthesis
MRIGVVIDETPGFFPEIDAELKAHHTVSHYRRPETRWPLFNERLQRYAFQQSLRDFCRRHPVVFFEWTSELLGAASRQPKTCGVAARMHRYELYRHAHGINWDYVDRLIVVSQAKQREFAERFPEQAGKTVVIPVGISLDKFAFRRREFSGEIGILCHLTPRKRVYELILAFHALLQQRPGYRLHIGGGEHPLFGDYSRALHALVRSLGLQDRVIFYGNVADAQAWYADIDIFISNSYSEGLQVAPMEAIAGGRYCLAHCWEGADELLPPGALYLTESELVEAVLAYSDLSEAERHARIDEQRERVAARFDIAKIKVQVRQVVEQVGDEWRQAGR